MDRRSVILTGGGSAAVAMAGGGAKLAFPDMIVPFEYAFALMCFGIFIGAATLIYALWPQTDANGRKDGNEVDGGQGTCMVNSKITPSSGQLFGVVSSSLPNLSLSPLIGAHFVGIKGANFGDFNIEMGNLSTGLRIDYSENITFGNIHIRG